MTMLQELGPYDESSFLPVGLVFQIIIFLGGTTNGRFLVCFHAGLEYLRTRATRCLQLAHVAKQEGHQVKVFLPDHAVFLAKKGMAEKWWPLLETCKHLFGTLEASQSPFLRLSALCQISSG